MGCAYYRGTTHPPDLSDKSAEAIARAILGEFAEGVDGTRIRPGVIGEACCSWPLLEEEKKVPRGAAMAQH